MRNGHGEVKEMCWAMRKILLFLQSFHHSSNPSVGTLSVSSAFRNHCVITYLPKHKNIVRTQLCQPWNDASITAVGG